MGAKHTKFHFIYENYHSCRNKVPTSRQWSLSTRSAHKTQEIINCAGDIKRQKLAMQRKTSENKTTIFDLYNFISQYSINSLSSYCVCLWFRKNQMKIDKLLFCYVRSCKFCFDFISTSVISLFFYPFRFASSCRKLKWADSKLGFS